MRFSPYLGVFFGGGGLPKGPWHNLLLQFYSLGSSKMVDPLPSVRCLAEGNRIWIARLLLKKNAAVDKGAIFLLEA